MIRVVLDTNVLLVSISSKSPLRWVIDHLMKEDYILCVTTDILLKYEEILAKHMGKAIALTVMESLENAQMWNILPGTSNGI